MPDKNAVLVTRPAYDPPTHYLCFWSESVIKVAKEKGLKVIDLRDKEAKREILERHLEKNDPRLVVFNGHGTGDCITGFRKDHILVLAGENETILKERITCAISCNCAKKLGPDSIRAGATAFVGFKGKFALLHGEWNSATPRRDKTAAYFLDPAYAVPISLIKGNSVGEAFEKSQFAFDKSIQYFETHYTPENSHILTWLRYNKAIQAVCGNTSAHL